MLLLRRAHSVFPVRARHAAAGAQRQLQRDEPQRERARATADHGGSGTEPRAPPGPRRQLQVQPALPLTGNGLFGGQSRVVSAT